MRDGWRGIKTALLLMIGAYPDDALATNKLPRRKKAIKPLTRVDACRAYSAWQKLRGGYLLVSDTARTIRDSRKAKIGDYAEVVRDMRNLAHPARYMEDRCRSA